MQISTATIFLGVFILAGSTFAGGGLFNVWRGHASVGWPQVPGQVIRSEIIDNSDSDGQSYKPAVEYRYVVHGQEFTGKRVAFGLELGVSNRQTVENYVKRLPLATPVSVFYRPDSPEVSVLYPGIAKHAFVPVAFGLMFVCFALWLRLMFWLTSP